MNRIRLFSVVGIILLLLSAVAIDLLEESDYSHIGLRVLGDRVKEVEYGKTIQYRFNVIKTRSENSDVNLEIVHVPEHWDAKLSHSHFTLSGDSNKIIEMRVTAPTSEHMGDPDLAKVAAIGIRGGNETVGTLSVIRGTAVVWREGDYYDYTSGTVDIDHLDIITTDGSPELWIDWSTITGGDYEGNTTLVLKDAHTAYYRDDGKLYVAIQEGVISFFGEGFGEGKNIFRGDDGDAPVTISRASNSLIDSAFPGFVYTTVVILDPSLIDTDNMGDDAFFTVSSSFANNVYDVDVEVYEGNVTVENEDDVSYVSEHGTLDLDERGLIDEFLFQNRTVISIQSDGNVETEITSSGENILNLDNTIHMIIGDTEYFIFDIQTDGSDIEISATGDGNYTAKFATIDNEEVKSFEITTTASLATSDTYHYTPDRLDLSDMELGKTYDMTISHLDLDTGSTATFSVYDVDTVEDETGFEVENWAALDVDEVDPVIFHKGDEQVEITNGMIGTDIYELFAILHAQEEVRLRNYIPYLILPAILAFAGGYKMFMAAGLYKDLVVGDITIIPSELNIGDPSEITAIIKNNGKKRTGVKHPILVTFYDNFVPIAKEFIDLEEEEFERGGARNVVIPWVPDLSGPHSIQVAVDVDDTEVDTGRTDLSIKDPSIPSNLEN